MSIFESDQGQSESWPGIFVLQLQYAISLRETDTKKYHPQVLLFRVFSIFSFSLNITVV